MPIKLEARAESDDGRRVPVLLYPPPPGNIADKGSWQIRCAYGFWVSCHALSGGTNSRTCKFALHIIELTIFLLPQDGVRYVHTLPDGAISSKTCHFPLYSCL